MKPSPFTRFSVLALLALGLILACPAIPLAARVNVTVTADESETPLERQSLAMEKAFASAVTVEALEILPGDPGAQRSQYLLEFLSPRAEELVVGYTELFQEETGDFLRLSLDVNVNRDALSKVLKRVGIYYTLDQPVPYVLSVMGPAMEKWQEIAALQTLSGLKAVSQAEESLVLNYDAEKGWSGELTVADQTFSAARSELPDVWYSLWSRYFSQDPVQVERTKSMLLTVSGWSSPDGVDAFDTELRAMSRILETVELMEVMLTPEGVSANWRVDAVDTGALERMLIDRLRGRGLTFSYETG